MATPKKRRGRSHKEQGIQGKRIAEAFYPADWLAASDVHLAPPMARGIWIDCLAHMWRNRTGTISGPVHELSRLLWCTVDDVFEFIRHSQQYGFCDVEIEHATQFSAAFPDTFREFSANFPGIFRANSEACHTPCHAIVTISCRRLERRAQRQEDARLRKEAERQRKAKKKPCHTNVTHAVTAWSGPPSSSSSSSPLGKEEGMKEKEATTKTAKEAASATACPTGQSRTATTAKPQPAPGPVDRLAKLITAEPHKLSLDDRKQLSLLAMIHEGKIDAVIASHNGSGPISISRLRQLLEAQP